ncbi:D-alanine--D-alanine ligase [Desulfitobacterium dehalogenans ATCC 51507]|uniref:D-alanine--D-alanine ligase n=1 Tax=Desulfitobacterium dehalogenans (strain ATCC 51507 / DSM 9161 / JW/IU-DC1) TaxID=756499 RepID=I4A995_DESDJ|nr:D-alanine--D-alanine ligase [Desulfitobacterium dehalogenans]AFM00530.1 D-alanine--D-alanine ligase [Desulfitobacterium dehalogenans ATCC 51507]
MTRQKIIILFGGQSGEHEVSLNSASSVLKAIDKEKYEVETLGISKSGQWHWGIRPEQWQQDPTLQGILVNLVHDPSNPRFIALDGSTLPQDGTFDLIFPVLHGPFGEDGTIQGLFEMANIPYAGSGVLGSALGMDKDRMKAVFTEAGLPQAPYLTVLRTTLQKMMEKVLHDIEHSLGYPCFVKPANLGSSVGISKARNREELINALHLAAEYDRKIVVEQNIVGREIELSVLGNEDAKASIPGEILPSKDFYDYEAKYIDTGSRLVIPAPLDQEVVKSLQEKAVAAFKAVEACGLSRVDFFVTEGNQIYINEINTMPGFTQISMYPKLWEASGIPYSELITQLIELGFQRFRDSRSRKISL